MTTLYVGNLPFSASEDEIRGLFGQHGAVDSVKIITDRDTGRPRGFAFVDMPPDAAQAAISALNGFEMNGRGLRVNEARERPPRAPRGGTAGGGGDRW
jgi:RNA recognition motif-containing protein